jgi:hypothetical protein
MKARKTRTGAGQYSLCAALAGLGLMAWTGLAMAQNTISADTVPGQAGQTIAVPITINTGSNNVAFFAATFTVVAQDGAPAITDALTYQTASGVPAPDTVVPVAAQGKLAIGYVSTTISPPLSGTLVVGNLKVAIPAGATGGSYAVQLSKVSAGDSSGGKVTLTPSNGAITLGEAATPTPTEGPVANSLSAGTVPGQAQQTIAVPITINTGSNNVAFFAVTFTVVAQNGAPAITDALSYQTASGVPAPDTVVPVAAQGKLAIGYVSTTISPPLSGTLVVGNLMVPIPAGATGGSYAVQLSKLSAGDSSGGKVTLTPLSGTVTLAGTPPPITPPSATPTTPAVPSATPTTPAVPSATPTTPAVPSATPTTPAVASATPTKPAATATPTATRTPTGGACPGCPEDDDGCQISAPGNTPAWLLLIPAIGLLVVRRKRR